MLQLCDVTVKYGDHVVIDGLSANIPPGIHAVMSPSGGGKTTLLRAIAGLVDYSGTIAYDGQPAMLFQEDRLFPWLTVSQNAALFARGREQQAELWLERMGLGDYAQSYPQDLSGGMQRRVSIAAMLAYQGDILLMDEPTRGLDAAWAQQVLQMIGEEANGKIAIIATHSLQEAKRFAQQIFTFQPPLRQLEPLQD